MKKIFFLISVLAVLLRGSVVAQKTTETIDLSTENPIEKAGWDFVWGDEFDSDTLNWSKWWPQECTHGTELQYYTQRKENVFTKDGKLYIRAIKENFKDSFLYTSGEIFSAIEFGRGHLIEIRCKIPKGRGLWPAFWFWSGRNKMYQEIDAFEIWSDNTRQFLVSNYWRDPKTDKVESINKHIKPKDMDGRRIDMSEHYLTFATYWDEMGVRYLLNNKLVAQFKNNIAVDPLPIILNLAVSDGKFKPNGKTVFPADYIIDYVRVYKKQGTQTFIRN
jgi:beta-glucanase (GH16 family)